MLCIKLYYTIQDYIWAAERDDACDHCAAYYASLLPRFPRAGGF